MFSFSPFHHSSSSQTLNGHPTALLLHPTGDTLFIGTSDGTLHRYKLSKEKNQQPPKLEQSLIKLTTQGNQLTASAGIDSLHFIKEINALVVLSAANISLYDITHWKLQLNSSKWTKSLASSATLQTNILHQLNQQLIPNSNYPPQAENNSDQIPILFSILAVPCKRRLVLFSWKDGQWLDPKEINLPHQVRSLTFPTPLNLFLGYSTGDYATIKLTIPYNSHQPIIHQISEPFPSPISHLITRAITDSPSPIPNSSTPPPKVNSLSSLAFKTTSGLVTLGLTGQAKVVKNSVIRLGSPTHEVIGIKDQIITFFNQNGQLTRSQTLQQHPGLNSIPSSIIYPTPPSETIVKQPYLISLLSSTTTNQSTSSLIIHSIPTLSHLQTIPFPPTQDAHKPYSTANSSSSSPSGKKPSLEPAFQPRPSQHHHPHLLTSSPNSSLIFLIAPQSNQPENSFQYQLECLQMKPWPIQIQQLIELGEYEEALGLMDGLDETHLPNKAVLLKKLNALCGVIDFSKYKYDRAIDTFISLSINPAKVVALYPQEISGTFAKRREEWEQLFGGRRAENYRSTPLIIGPHPPVSEPAHHPHRSRPGSDVGSLPRSGFSHHAANTLVDDDRRSVLSGPSAAPTKGKTADPTLTKTTTDDKGQDDVHFRSSVEVLIRYLTDRRQQVNRAFGATQDRQGLKEEEGGQGGEGKQAVEDLQPSETIFQLEDRPISEIETRAELVQVAKVIDTSLFKSYLVLRPTMLGPLCRLPNWCEVEQVEGLLMEAKRYHELLDLYHGKGQHAKALKLLKKMAMNEEDVQAQIEPTVRYLQKLGSTHLSLILESSKWVFSLCQEQEEEEEGGSTAGCSLGLVKAALEIFVADLSAVESLPKHKIVAFLESLKSPTPIRLYLEFVVRSQKDQDPFFHEQLIQIYVVEFKRLRGLGQLERAQGIYQKLLDHLQDSTSYSSNWVLGRLPPDDMYEARALALGNVGQHDTALRIYVERLGDLGAAEEYCKRVYDKTSGADGSIFLCLLKICLRPTLPEMMSGAGHHKEVKELETKSDGVEEEKGDSGRGGFLGSERLLEAGLELMAQHGHKIADVDELVLLVPPLVPLARLGLFFRRAVAARAPRLRRQRILVSCLAARDLSLATARAALEQRRVKVDQRRLCTGCGKRLGNSVIAVHPP
ncbi:hypothetical protein PCANC_12409 [Puccinia coronata f. sp. avenae]|uniref:CNH domain-containing protein n=1 Tax=Puccinia coronata f. sp. avenae TaxID=200324 RepID=A0A2N5VBA3_9BASI|nr:hypothetical protein PCANC_12409 [Puccinia coronata f. sp. avenae]